MPLEGTECGACVPSPGGNMKIRWLAMEETIVYNCSRVLSVEDYWIGDLRYVSGKGWEFEPLGPFLSTTYPASRLGQVLMEVLLDRPDLAQLPNTPESQKKIEEFLESIARLETS